jgi:SAM-dependent methyltransferase
VRWKTIGVVVACANVVVAGAQQHQPPGKPDHMQHRFDDPARFAKSFDDPARDRWQMPDRVIAALKLPSTASVADIGAGTGYFTVRLAKAVPAGTVYAVDIEPAMVEHIRNRAATAHLTNVMAVVATPHDPKLPKPVDTVIVVDTYHHIPDRALYFRDLKRSLTPSGRVAIIDFREDAPEGPPPEFRFDADQIISEMKQAGFVLDAKHDFLPRQHFLVFRRTLRDGLLRNRCDRASVPWWAASALGCRRRTGSRLADRPTRSFAAATGTPRRGDVRDSRRTCESRLL